MINRRLDEELTRFALSGTAEQVKYAATILAVVPDKAATCREVNVVSVVGFVNRVW